MRTSWRSSPRPSDGISSSRFVDAAKVNWAHVCIAQLMKQGYVDRILTTNFDPLIIRACALLGLFPAVYDFASSQLFSTPDIPIRPPFPHGQRSGFVLLNTARGGREPCRAPEAGLRRGGAGASLDRRRLQRRERPRLRAADRFPALRQQALLGRLPRQRAGGPRTRVCWWTTSSRTTSPASTRLVLRDAAAEPRVLSAGLHRPAVHAPEGANRGPQPCINLWTSKARRTSPIAQLDDRSSDRAVRDRSSCRGRAAASDLLAAGKLEELEQVQAETEQITPEVARARLGSGLAGQRALEQAGEAPAGAPDPLFESAAGRTSSRRSNPTCTRRSTTGERALGPGKMGPATKPTGSSPSQARNSKQPSQSSPTSTRRSTTGGSHSPSGGHTKSGTRLHGDNNTAGEKFEAALAIQPDLHQALYNWGNALSGLASTKSGEVAGRLFTLAGEKYEAALRIKPDLYEALINWGQSVLPTWANTESQEDASRLRRLAREKLLAAEEIRRERAYNLCPPQRL